MPLVRKKDAFFTVPASLYFLNQATPFASSGKFFTCKYFSPPALPSLDSLSPLASSPFGRSSGFAGLAAMYGSVALATPASCAASSAMLPTQSDLCAHPKASNFLFHKHLILE